MTRPTEPLPPYHLIDDYHTRAGLTPELILAIGLSARRHGLARVDAVAAVVPGSECDQYEYRLDLPTGAVSATWLIDHGGPRAVLFRADSGFRSEAEARRESWCP